MKIAKAATTAAIVALAGFASLALAARLMAADEAQPAGQLERTIEDVARRWPDIQHVPTDDVARMMIEKSALIFDVRSEQEFRVSHLEGAIRIDPATDSAEFMKAHGETLKGKTAVFYCSVGVRSSKLAERVAQSAKEAGALGVQNMRGGIFAWHQEQRPLFDAKGAIELVHPYDKIWGRAVTRQQNISTEGRP